MTALPNSNLPPLLQKMQVEIEGYARGYGLDFYPTLFEHIDAADLNALAAAAR
jgi:stage V sporulation protein R